MAGIKIGSAARIEIGIDGESGTRPIVFDAAQWIDRLPGCEAVIVGVRADGEAFAAPDVKVDRVAKTIIWTPTAAETIEGEGEAQLLWMDGERVAKHAIMTTVCYRSLKTDATVPDAPEPTWGQKAIEAMQRAQDAAAKADAAKTAVTAEKESALAGIVGAETTALESIEQAKGEAMEEIGESTGTVAGAITPTAQGDVIALFDSADRPIRGLTIFGRTTQDGTPSQDAPVALESVGADGAVEIRMCGANLLDIEQLEGSTTADVSVSGTEVTLTAKSEGTYRQSKRIKILTASSPVEVSASWELVSRSVESFNPFCTGYWYKDNVQLKSESFMVWPKTSVSKTVTPPVAGAELYIIFALNERTTAAVGDSCTLKNIMFNVGAQMPYEAHKKQNATITMANGLPGVPVTSGGNYTDANGQQWIADSIEYDAETGAGERVKRVEQIDNYAGEAITGAYLSTTGELSEGATVIYALETPIETEISAEEIASIAGMKTHYPNTTIYNSDGAHMEAKYIADTKMYIDKENDAAATERFEIASRVEEVAETVSKKADSFEVAPGLQMKDGVLGVVPEVYELIETITLDEDMVIERTAEPDGTPYNFKAVSIRVRKADGIILQKDVSMQAKFSSGRAQSLYLPTTNVSAEQWGYAEVRQYKGFWERERSAAWSIYNETATPMLVKISMFDMKVLPEENIVKVYGANVKAGLTIEIWGVRANA